MNRINRRLTFCESALVFGKLIESLVVDLTRTPFMITFIRNKIQPILRAGNERAAKIKRNIIYSFLIKAMSALIGYLLFSITIHYVKPLQYGIWLTISSMVAWMGTFDIGLSNGLRNKLANSIALNEHENNARYVSTTYALIFLVAVSIFILFVVIGSLFNWNDLLNIPAEQAGNLWLIMVIAVGTFCIQFVLQPINSVLLATHQPFKSSLILLAGQGLTFALILLLTIFTTGNLLTLVIVVTGSPIIVFVLANVYLFSAELRALAPRPKLVDLKIAKSLLNLGGVFFIIQIGALIIFETDNIIIVRMLGPTDVTVFNAVFKYFSIINVAFSIIMAPYWSAFTDAYAKGDFIFIKRSIAKTRRIWFCFALLTIIMYLVSDVFYKIWLGRQVTIPATLSISMGIYFIVQTWQFLHAYVLNGTGKLRIQLIFIVAAAILNVPLSIFLIKKVGVNGTVIANILLMIIMDIVFTYQSELIINERAKGIWDK